VLAFRQALGLALLASFGAVMAGSPAQAQGKLDAQYSVTLAGIPIGKGTWTIEIADNQFSATGTGRTTGLLRAFTSGEGKTAAKGTIQAGKVTASSYTSAITTSHKHDETRLVIANGTVKEVTVDPPLDNDPERVPVTDAHQKGVLDPMTGTMFVVPGQGDPLTPEACQKTVSVFDGRLRYDLNLAFKRMDKVKADKGYAGPVVVCAVYFSPVAGYIPSRMAIKYLAKLRDMEVWLAPIAGTRVLVPFRAEGPTPIGHAVMEATQFVSVPSPTRASANGTKVQ
jgi:hypothetical protein